MDINTQKTTYFAQSTDISMPGEMTPDTQGGNKATYLIDGNAYFGAIRSEIATLLGGGSNPYFYFSDWCLGTAQGPASNRTGTGSSAWSLDADMSNQPPFQLNDGTGGPYPLLSDQLVAMVAAKVDVRGFAWINPFIVNNKQVASDPAVESFWAVNIFSMTSIMALQQAAGMTDRLMMNTLGHTAASMHLKMVVCGDDTRMTAYVGGLDFLASRYGDWTHATEKWHDAAVSIQGPSATAIHNHFVALWNEEVKRSIKTFKFQGQTIQSRTSSTPLLSQRTAPALATPGTQWVQVLRTLPQMNFNTFYNGSEPISCLKQIIIRLFLGFKSDKISFAPDGIFEFRIALKKAISAATTYIYIEDQSFYGIEIMQWINARLLDSSVPNLKVILLNGADPSDPPNTFMASAISALVAGVPNANQRVMFFERGDSVIVHTKVTIIDDLWSAIGSANCFRRSLYTDGECSVGVLDENTTTPFAQSLRKDLWGEHCNLAPDTVDPSHPRDALLPLDAALAIWNSAWGTPPPGVALRPAIVSMIVPFQYSTTPTTGQWNGAAPVFSQQSYDLGDADSRQMF